MSDEAHLLFEPEDEPNIISHSTPSDYAPPAIPRNDGRGVHHQAELEKDLARAQAELDELKVLAGLAPAEEELGGA